MIFLETVTLLSIYCYRLLTGISYVYCIRKENQEKERAKKKKEEDEQTRHVYVIFEV